MTRVDQHIADQQHTDNLRDGDRVHLAQLVTHLGSTVVLIAVVLVVAVWLAVFHHRRRQALFLVTTAVLGEITNNIIKAVVGRSRPHFTHAVAHAFGKSFPSGKGPRRNNLRSCSSHGPCGTASGEAYNVQVVPAQALTR